MSYIKPQLLKSTLFMSMCCISLMSYIKPQPREVAAQLVGCCISLMSYIKPQPPSEIKTRISVVYRLCPTSNHNYSETERAESWLYIAYVLHQTTTVSMLIISVISCISLMSYIKPQLFTLQKSQRRVVYRLCPTSNHN